MSRFGNLELEGGASELQPESRQNQDASRWLVEAETAFGQMEFESALRFYARVLEFDANQSTAWAGQVRALIELGEFREAQVWADKALERLPTSPELLAAKGVALARLGDLDSALALSDASLEERGDTPYIWLARGDVLLARKEGRAEFCFERACSLAPRNALIVWLAGRIRHYYDQFAAALKLAQTAVELDAGRFAHWVLMGDCQLALGWSENARRSWIQAEQLAPRSDAVSRRLLQLDRRGLVPKLLGKVRDLLR
ncbi:MAG: tetratricopeptide repeat protein [Verrucomicrobia bacterium]|nr:tetratricopeptide repeat protein [Verrucomicrobiota bacterium]